MQMVSLGDHLHELPKSIFWKKNKKNITNLSSAGYALIVVRVIRSRRRFLDSAEMLTFITLWVNSADDDLIIDFLILLEGRV